ncbi:MAG: phosphate ABC transporter permease subunit PstC [Actinobacteria bacterium]|nr:phosphate ABC transporter permease subunit PstC [Actinomycetota bacterium]MDA2976659.1 phosphate ABC transporter permease subunit PstC [Actinomycetota bacterium]MDA2985595.1 phosphate ABC transporter permease subunit PstC [Actinomycetota bacterium]
MTTSGAQVKPKVRLGDLIFSRAATFAGVGILATLAAVAVFLFIQALPALGPDADFAGKAEDPISYVTPYIFGTLYGSIMALAISTPLAIGIALYISHYANRRFSQILGYIMDLLAAIPSVVYGLWGILVLAPFLNPSYLWLNENLGWIPLFEGQVSATGRTMLTVAIVLAIMVLPIMAALIREVFLQTPRLHEEAALALGATRWEMIKMAVLPFGRPGIISAMMLGFGRALGETMAVALVLSPASIVSFALLTSQNSNTIAANIALDFPESGGDYRSLLISTGLFLFLITMVINLIARYIISRRAEFSGAN